MVWVGVEMDVKHHGSYSFTKIIVLTQVMAGVVEEKAIMFAIISQTPVKVICVFASDQATLG